MNGNDPDYISSMEHFESMRHEEIYAKTQQIDAAQILSASAAWLEVAGTLATSFPLTRASSDRVMNSMEWEGATADAAYASARSYAESVDELAAIMGQVGARLGGVAAAAEAVKIAVVPPAARARSARSRNCWRPAALSTHRWRRRHCARKPSSR